MLVLVAPVAIRHEHVAGVRDAARAKQREWRGSAQRDRRRLRPANRPQEEVASATVLGGVGVGVTIGVGTTPGGVGVAPGGVGSVCRDGTLQLPQLHAVKKRDRREHGEQPNGA